MRAESGRLQSLIRIGVIASILGATIVVGSPTPAAAADACDGNNHQDDAFTWAATFGGPLIGIEWTASATQTITRLEFFMWGFGDLPAALGIWTDDGGRPGSALGYTGYFPVDDVWSWQGSSLNSSVDVVAGTTYWLVIDPNGSMRVASAPGGVVQTYWGSFSGDISGGAAWFGPHSGYAWKFRMLCGAQTMGDVLADRPGKGLDDAPGLQRPRNEHFPWDRVTKAR